MSRAATHRTCESHHRLDVRELVRHGLLDRTSTITWSCRGDVTGTISVHENGGDSVILNYAIDGQKIEERVLLSKTKMNFGGERSWFLCPGCNRRIAVLYGGKLFRCRHCLGLRYVSQRETPRFRSISRIQRIRNKMGGSGNLVKSRPKRPRYMHSRTYQRLIDEENEAWQAYASTR
jgi:hypothetical protein